MKISPLKPPIPKTHDHRWQWGNLLGSSASLAFTAFAKTTQKPVLLITPDVQSANRLQREIEFFKERDLPVTFFPDWETLPYDHFSPHTDLVSERLSALFRLQHLNNGIIIIALPTLMHRILPKEYLHTNSFVTAVGDILNLEQFRNNLITAGYHVAQQVMAHGEFAIRGSIVDVFPMGHHTPYRIELFDDRVDTIRTFDPETQRSDHKIEKIQLLPAREYPLDEKAVAKFRQNWRERFAGNPMESPIYSSISEAEPFAGVEYYLPLFFENTQTFFDYLPKESLIIFHENTEQAAETFWQEISRRYEQLRYDVTRPLCAPSELFISVNELFSFMKLNRQIKFTDKQILEQQGSINFSCHLLPNLMMNAKNKQPLTNLQDFLATHSHRTLIIAESSGRKENLLQLLRENELFPEATHSWQEFLSSTMPLAILAAPMEQALFIDAPDIVLITEAQLYGEKVKQKRLKSRRELDPDVMIKNLTELNIGAPIVHINYGIGRYLGLQTITTSNITGEYLQLEYADGDKIYVPVADLHLISRYTGIDSEHAPISRLGSKQWEKTKKKVAEKLRDVAAELLDIYSKRQAAIGHAFPSPAEEFNAFRAAFPFEETPDQAQAIDSVISDMTSEKVMDRLVCGDVGFGKTEVAMQAAFISVQNHRQVAMLVPTTLLATQHYQNFIDRFSDWPFRIDYLSRMRSPKETQGVLQNLADGKVDIIIGTHKLLSENIEFSNLGLLIVDEEHRFGVRDKERIKQLRANVDILTLTATPIPRTLNMAMSGIRDLSLITTPPARRLAIKTFVHEFNEQLIREAIMREAMRGGQVYFLHNEVATIQAMSEKLQQIVPQARIAIAHGQMPERQLERVMTDFYHQKFNILLCTTIIESGIDIPTANTIIINNANRFGLAQLHQIRGRVGRSHHQAYAYLLVASKKNITSDAKKRLEALANLEELGAGFHLATHDLEIRGAGEILGEEQSGHMQSIGFNLYMEILDNAITALKAGKKLDDITEPAAGVDIDLRVSALLPENYIHDVNNRLIIYKRLTNCRTDSEIDDLKAELIDRFGLLPSEAENLFSITRLKLRAKQLGINKIDVGTQYGRIHFIDKPNVDPAKIIKLIQLHPKKYQLADANTLRFPIEITNASQNIAAAIAAIKAIE